MSLKMTKAATACAVAALISLAPISILAQDPPNTMKEKNEGVGAVKMATVYFVSPKNGATVGTKFKVIMAAEGIKVRPAGEAPDELTSGHHHLIIDGVAAPAGQTIPTDAAHLHFGKAQSETELTLKPGEHTLTLQFADGAHRSFGEKMSQTIKVNVK